MWRVLHKTGVITGWLTCGLLISLLLVPPAGGVAGDEELPPAGELLNRPLPNHAYAAGEVLNYRISWSGIPAGHASMAVSEERGEGDDPVTVFTSVTRSNKTVSVFYKVRDRVVSRINAETGAPFLIEIDQRHGRRKRIRTTSFDQQAQQATTFQTNRDPVTVDTPPAVQDILSVLYYLRTLPELKPGHTEVLDVHEGKKNWRLLVKTIGKGRIKTPAGRFDTVQVKAEVRFKGVFFDRGDVRIWFTDDVRHVPVKIAIKIRIGKVLVELKSQTIPPLS